MTTSGASIAVARPSRKKAHVSGDVVRPNFVVGAGDMIMALFLILPMYALLQRAWESGEFFASLVTPFALDALRLSTITTTAGASSLNESVTGSGGLFLRCAGPVQRRRRRRSAPGKAVQVWPASRDIE
jgi:hypothetical protein